MASSGKRLYVNGYDELKMTLKQIGKDKRIFVFFFDSKAEQKHSCYADDFAMIKPVEETIESSMPSNGIYIECSIGDKWKDANCSFRKDPQLRLTHIPTLVEWGTSKRLTDTQLLDSDMIQILFEDD